MMALRNISLVTILRCIIVVMVVASRTGRVRSYLHLKKRAEPSPEPPRIPAKKNKYFMPDGVYNFSQGKKVCAERGGVVAIIKNKEENRAALVASPRCLNSGCNAWIGLRFDNKQNVHKWIDGTSTNYTNWSHRKPIQPENRPCVLMTIGPGGLYGNWITYYCNKVKNLMCEVVVTTSSSSTTSPPAATSSSAASPPVEWKNTPKITKFTTGEVEIGKIIRCSAKGHPPPHVIIAMKRIDGLFIEASIGVNKTEYKVPGDIDTGSRVVSCITVNSHGSDTKNSNITIKRTGLHLQEAK